MPSSDAVGLLRVEQRRQTTALGAPCRERSPGGVTRKDDRSSLRPSSPSPQVSDYGRSATWYFSAASLITLRSTVPRSASTASAATVIDSASTPKNRRAAG